MATKTYVSLDKLTKYDALIKAKIAADDATTLASAKAYADGLAGNYEKAGAIATAKTELEGKIATAQAAADTAGAAAATAQGEVDALETLVGTLPEGTTATTVIGYVDAKTAGIATDAALTELNGQVTGLQTAVQGIKDDYLTSTDKTELSDAIGAETTRATGIEAGLRTDVDAIKGNYLKDTDKTELQGGIDGNAEAIAAVKEDIDAFLAAAEVGDAAVDTLKEIQTYITTDGEAAATMTGNIAANATAIEGLDGRLTTAEGKITTAEGKITANEEAIAALQGVVGEGGSVDGKIEDAVDTAIEAEVERVDAELAKKVDKVEGYGLSKNDLTDELKGQYDAAYAHSQAAHAPVDAQVNVIESVKVNGAALTITGKAVDIAVPVDNSELTNGAGYITSAAIENKADKATTLSGYGIADAYTQTQTDSAIATAMAQFVECSEQDVLDLFA